MLNHVQKDHRSFLTIPHGRFPETDFGNPSLFPKIYPTLFPYEIRGFEDNSRQHKITFKQHVKHLLQLKDK